MCEVAKKEILEKSSNTLILGPTTGLEILMEAEDMFARTDSGFQSNEKEEPTEKILVVPCNVVQDSKLLQMFNSLSDDIIGLRLTRSQIIKFVKQHPDSLPLDSYGIFFLLGSLVAYVNRDYGLGKPEVLTFEFSDPRIWDGNFDYRLVVPV